MIMENNLFPEIRVLDHSKLLYTNGSYNGENVTVYLPKNENLKPLTAAIRKNSGGNGKVYQDLAGEDIAHEVLAHSNELLAEGTQLVGFSGSDFALNTLFTYRPDDREDIPDDMHKFYLVSGVNGSARYAADPAKLFKMISDAKDTGKVLAFIRGREAISLEPVSYGKTAWFTLFGPMTDDLMGLYDDIARRAPNLELGITKQYNKVVKRVKGFLEEDRNEFFSKEFNKPENIALRIGVRNLSLKDLDVADEIFQKAIEPYSGRDVGVFSEKRFEYLSRACVQHILTPLDITATMHLRTRSLEAAHARQPVPKVMAKNLNHGSLLMEIGETLISSTARGLEPYERIGKTTPVEIRKNEIVSTA